MPARAASRHHARLAALLLLPLAGCKVMTIKEDQALRARRNDALDPAAYVASIWTRQALPHLDRDAAPLDKVDAAMAADLDRAGAAYGRRVADSAPWTFVVRGSGVVSAVDRTSREGAVEVSATDGRPVVIQTGPVIVDTAVRDALPFIRFNDFSDQIAYAGVGDALTRRALADNAAVLASLAPGDHVEFLGAADVASADAPLRVTPVRLKRVS